MKRINNILGIFTLAMVLMLPSGCAKESLSDEPTSSEGKVRLRINTDNGEFQIPSTRATANENAVDDVWVLVFKGSDYNATFVEAVKSIVTESERYVLLTQATGAHKLLVVANADTFINAKKALLTAGTTTLTGAISILQYGNPYNSTIPGDGALANPQIAMPFADPAKNIPMCEVLSVSRISSTTEINATGTAGGGTLELRRITAKVVVDGSAVFAKFKILGVAAYQGARSTVSLVPGDNNAIQTGGTFINYHKGTVSAPTDICTAFTPNLAAENNTENYPVYVYESTETANFIIIKAKLNIDEPSYYKLKLTKEDGTNYDIKRNHKYIFEIESVVDNVSSGYSTLKAAIDGAESNIAGKIIVVSEGNSADIIDNGTYYLGCSISELLVYTDESDTYMPALTITTNATAAMIGGVNSITTTNTGGNRWMGINETKIKLYTGGVAKVAETSVNIYFIRKFVDNHHGGTITLKLGNIVKEINVRVQPKLSFMAGSKEFATDYVSGKVTAGGEWLSLGIVNDPEQGSSQVTLPDQPGSIYLFTKQKFGARHTGGEVYLARSNNRGRVKIYVDQAGTFPAYPGVIGYDPVRGDLNLEGRGYMVYFKWGSLVAIYSSHLDRWSSDDVAFNPSSVTDFSAYTSVPYALATFPAQDIAAGLGDPCKLIGYKASEVTNSTNSGWRLPTIAEFSGFTTAESTVISVAATVAGDATERAGRTFTALNGFQFGNFLPFAGRRLDLGTGSYGNEGYYCSSSADDNVSYAKSLYLSDWRVYNPSISYYTSGVAVRCVRQ